MYDTMGTSFYDIHIIGHSLGSHIAGYVGRFIPALLGRISGLYPAGLKFARHNTMIRLNPAYAMFIDVIHTDDDTIFQLELSEQLSCSHTRAIHLHISSIDKRYKFIGRRCKSSDDYNKGRCEPYTALIGYWATPPVKPGKYYLKTTGVKPYVIRDIIKATIY